METMIQAGGSDGVGIRNWRQGLNVEGHLEERQGSGQALNACLPPCYWL